MLGIHCWTELHVHVSWIACLCIVFMYLIDTLVISLADHLEYWQTCNYCPSKGQFPCSRTYHSISTTHVFSVGLAIGNSVQLYLLPSVPKGCAAGYPGIHNSSGHSSAQIYWKYVSRIVSSIHGTGGPSQLLDPDPQLGFGKTWLRVTLYLRRTGIICKLCAMV